MTLPRDRGSMRPLLLLPMVTAAVTACGQSSLPPESPPANPLLSGGALVASAGWDGILLENRAGKMLRVSVVDSLFFENGFALWCTGQDECGIPLAIGERRLIPPGDVVGPPPRQKAVQVLWWAPVPGSPAEKSGRFERIYLRLP
jgi:hypothetical protein